MNSEANSRRALRLGGQDGRNDLKLKTPRFRFYPVRRAAQSLLYPFNNRRLSLNNRRLSAGYFLFASLW